MDWAGTPLPWAAIDGRRLEAKLRGQVTAPMQAALLGAALGGLLSFNPAFGGMFAALVPLFTRQIRSASAPVVALDPGALEVTANGHTVRRSRTEVLGASVVRDGGAWVLRVDTDDGPLDVPGDGMSPTELQWLADVISGWRVGIGELPPPRDSVVEPGLGATTYTYAAGLSAGDWAVGLAIVAVGTAGAIAGLPGEMVLLPSLGAVGGHLMGSRRSGRVEVRLTPQSVRIERTEPRLESRTVALEDVEQVELDGDWVTVVERGGRRHPVRAHGGAVALAEALRRAVAALPTPTPGVEAERRSERAAVSAMAARARQREG